MAASSAHPACSTSATIRVPAEVTALEPVSRLAIQGQLGPFWTRASYLLEPNGSATRLVNEMDIEALSAARRLVASLAVSRIKAAVAANLTELTRILERLFHQPLEERVSMSWTGTRDTGAGQVSLTIRTHPAAEWRIAGGAER